ncbi:MAG: UvrD-helicase domain-containing protein [Treponema sp.]|nr:UvrD-helicase domain-containing protein [Treponema sp.]
MIENKTNTFEIDNEALKILSSGLNDEQMAAVRETKNVVVSAGAGSGKTTVLASRYAYLLEAKNLTCDKILTLTFTKKAANEMKERIFNGLKSHLKGYDIKSKNQLGEDFPHLNLIKERAKKAIESFDKSHIQTLDSYFSEIAKKGARYYGIVPNFTLDDEKISSTVSFNATKYVLDHLSDSEIREIAHVFKIENLAEELFASSILNYSTVLTPIDFDSSLEKQKKRLLDDYEPLVEEISDKISVFIQAFASAGAGKTRDKMRECISENGNPRAPGLTEEIIEEGNASFILEYLRKISAYLESYFSQYLRDDSFKTLKKEFAPLLSKLYLMANSISGYPLQKKVFAHLKAFQEQVNKIKRTGGFLSFADVSQLALVSLCQHEEIRHVEQNKFDAIMIDEFQDDNQLQCDLLLILCDRHEKIQDGKYILPRLSDPDLLERLDSHKLFFVGDDKQSIYRFRGADVSVFRSLSSSIKNSLELKTNYRSDPELIRGFNTLFGGYDYPAGEKVNDANPGIFMTVEKFPPRTDGSERIADYEADYKRVEVPESKLKECDFSQKKITVALYPNGKKEEGSTYSVNEVSSDDARESENEKAEAERKACECEASYVVREIKKLVSLKDEKGEQKYHYKDIALLFRTSTPTGAYENVLLEGGIPYSTEVYKGFFSDGPINDIISLLKICVYPEDKNAWAKVLRSPFASLTLSQMEKVLVNTENPYRQPFDDEMMAAIAGDEEIFSKMEKLKAIYEDIKGRLKTEKLTKTIFYIWYELGYRYETMWNKSVSLYSSFYDILFEMARLAEEKTQSLAAFIDMVKSYEDSDQKLDGLDVVMEGEDAVQILTVHKSKGLEYKVVFVCAASALAKDFGQSLGMSEDFGFILKTGQWLDYDKAAEKLAKSGEIRKDNASKNYFFSILDDKNKREESAELRRLAYVAFTRAEERLYIVASEKGEYESEENSLKYQVHDERTKEFTYTKVSKTKSGETTSEASATFENPKTMYQLLLPLFYQGNSGEGIKNPAFNFVNDKEAFDSILVEEGQNLSPSDYIAKLDDQNLQVIKEELSPKVYISPSRLHGQEDSDKADEEYAALKSVNPDYALINKIVASTVPGLAGELPELRDGGEEENRAGDEISEENIGKTDSDKKELKPAFNFTNFGTIAHACMEGKVLGEEAKISGREWIGLNERFIPNVEMEKWEGNTNREKKISKIRELCQDMASRFESSQIYKEAVEAEWKKTEYTFRGILEHAKAPQDGENYAKDLIVTGQIDLVYKNREGSPYKYTIVDYKTNQKIKPSIYYQQLSCYRKALSQMLGVEEREIRCLLYYLRFAKEVDITEF